MVHLLFYQIGIDINTFRDNIKYFFYYNEQFAVLASYLSSYEFFHGESAVKRTSAHFFSKRVNLYQHPLHKWGS